MRPHATRRNDWAQLGMGACALLLPPLALGAAFYSMLATPDEGGAGPAGAVPDIRQPSADDAASRPAALSGPPATAAGGPVATQNRLSAPAAADQQPVGRSTAGRAQVPEQGPVQGIAVPVTIAPAAAVNPPAEPEGVAAGPPAAAALRRPPRRNAQRQPQQEDSPFKAWLQQIGILPAAGPASPHR